MLSIMLSIMLKARPQTPARISLILIVLALGGSALVAASSGARAEAAIRVLAKPDYPPYSFLQDGEPAGMEIDVMQALGEVLPRDIAITLLPWHLALQQAIEGKAEALIGFPVSVEARDHWLLTRPILTHRYSLFVTVGESAIHGLHDLAGRRVAYASDGMAASLIQLQGGVKLVHTTDVLQALKKLQSGEVDAVAADTDVGNQLLQRHALSDITTAGRPYANADVAIAVPPHAIELAKQLDEALGVLDRDGTLERIRRKWASDREPSLSRQELEDLAELLSLAIGSLILFGFAAWVLTLRREVAERTRVADALTASEKRFRVLVENSPEGIVVWDADAGRIVDANPSMERILGYGRDVLTTISPRTLYAENQPDGLPLAQTFSANVERALQGETPTFTRRLRKRSGEDLLCEVRLLRLPSERQRLVRATFVDITERRRTESALRLRQAQIESIFRGSPFGIGQVLKQQITLVNERFCELLGYTNDEAAGQDMRALFESEAEAERVRRETLRQIRAHGKAEIETRLRRKDGSTVDALVSVIPIFGSDVNREVTFTILDITERKQASEALQAAYARQRALSAKLLDAQENERRGIALELHDEIGQALTAVKLKLHSLSRQLPDTDAAAQIAACTDITDTALQQVRNLSLDLRPPQLDLMGLEAALRWLLTIRTESSGLTPHLNASLGNSGRTPQIEISCFRVVQEALTNAIRHARAQNVWVDIEQNDDFIEITIRDDGIGFDAGAARQASAQGRSMGLLSMEERLSLLGGTFTITSRPGAGTQLRGRIPLQFPEMEVSPIWGAN